MCLPWNVMIDLTSTVVVTVAGQYYNNNTRSICDLWLIEPVKF